MNPLMLSLFFVLTSGCTTLTLLSPNIPLGGGLNLLMAQPKEILPEVSAVQLLTANFGSQTFSHEVIMKNADNVLSIVGVGPLGNISYSLTYDGHEVRGTDLPAAIKSEHLKYAVGDIIIVFSNSSQLTRLMPAGAKLIESPQQREVWINGKKALEVNYEAADHWVGTVKYKNFLRNYELIIKTLKMDKQ